MDTSYKWIRAKPSVPPTWTHARPRAPTTTARPALTQRANRPPAAAPSKLGLADRVAASARRACSSVRSLFKRRIAASAPPMPRRPGLTQEGDPGIQRPVLCQRGRLDPHDIEPAGLATLPGTVLEQTRTELRKVGELLSRQGRDEQAFETLRRLAGGVQEALAADKTLGVRQRLSLALSDGQAFVAEMQTCILEAVEPGERRRVEGLLGGARWKNLLEAYDCMVAGLLDREIPPAADSRPQVLINGKTYARCLDQPIARGAFGKVWLYGNVTNPDDLVVVKEPLGSGPDDRESRIVAPAREGWASLRAMGLGGGADHVATLVGAVRTEQAVQLVYRYAPGGTVASVIKDLDASVWALPAEERPAARACAARAKLGLMHDMLCGTARLEEAKGVLHLDIAARNVLVDHLGRAVIADFGLARTLPEGAPRGEPVVLSQDVRLPIAWCAPEMLYGTPTVKTNTWMLAMTFCEMIFGKTPFQGLSRFEVARRLEEIATGGRFPERYLPAINPTDWPGVDVQALRSLLLGMLHPDPAQRPSLHDVARSDLFKGLTQEDRANLARWASVAPASILPAPETQAEAAAALPPGNAVVSPAARPAPHPPYESGLQGLPHHYEHGLRVYETTVLTPRTAA